jgi:hypothetical protein
MLNIRPKSKKYPYPNFGHVYSEGERWGKELITKF